jgi:hypothetical protein
MKEGRKEGRKEGGKYYFFDLKGTFSVKITDFLRVFRALRGKKFYQLNYATTLIFLSIIFWQNWSISVYFVILIKIRPYGGKRRKKGKEKTTEMSTNKHRLK